MKGRCESNCEGNEVYPATFEDEENATKSQGTCHKSLWDMLLKVELFGLIVGLASLLPQLLHT